MDRVQPPLAFIPPNFNPWVWRCAKLALPFWRRSRAAIRDVRADNIDRLAELYQQFQSGKIRLMVAFRHPTARDPLCLAELIWNLLPRVARERGIDLQSPIHFHFIYDRGIPLWAGSFVGWGFSQLGGTPIHRGKLDWVGLKSARDLFANGQFPLAAAPEGGTNGHNEIVSPLEPGVAQLGFWCVEDLLAVGRWEEVWIVPLGIRYSYIDPPWQAIESLLAQLEAEIGQSSQPLPATATREEILYHRLFGLGSNLLVRMEQFYRRFYDRPLPADAALPGSNEELANRLQALLHEMLTVAEEFFHLRSKGNFIDRCRRLEQAGWDRIYREDVDRLQALSPIERSLADRVAEESNFHIWHMRVVENFIAVTGRYVRENPTAERFADMSSILWQTTRQIQNRSSSRPPRLGEQRAHLTVGEPISVTARWESYQGNRRRAKQAVADLTEDLQVALERTIDPIPCVGK
ncbi:MAG TPA: 1-acyl-sn-glycerol-3-phosphate acyltransferase [Oscillatoriales cyanobacterium M59_W2019_021]|nr:MAG: 1-acyl-sn-glycerol-3-phosphate acyltransferase [Cyanobacteria bacterium J055]HIK30352.1 1-acyl-sn-glycerol-3-phosphate acyltransferase [Oscillatoriales cyanobacterium M4454_W2019_049]HIK49596.1 1-acyl-sn-glycerol-3-phosphate acyltransferase [Oscillatoriales cyanobacterium M59_W2019_021]